MKAKTRLVGIDLLRFAAAFAVMLFHLGFWSWANTSSTPASVLKGATAYGELTSFSWWGWVGVHLFFVISGLVIAYSAQRASAVGFLQSRFLRLVPGALVCATLTLAVAAAIHMDTPIELLKRFVKSVIFYPYPGWIDGVYWTLSIEVSFYALVFAVVALGRFWLIEPVMALVGSMSSLWWVVSVSVWGTAPDITGLHYRTIDVLLVKHGVYFAIGVFIWLTFLNRATIWRVLLLILFIAGGALPIVHEANEMTQSLSLDVSPYVPLIIWLSSVGTLCAAVRFDGHIEKSLPDKVKSIIVMAGLATYPLYLLHDVMGAAALRVIILSGVNRFAALAIVGACMVALSFLIAQLVEPRVRAALRALIFTPRSLFSQPAE